MGNIAEKKNQVKPSVKQLIVTKRSTTEPANINDIDYEYDDDSTQEYQEQLTANHITSLLPNQVITVKTAIFFYFIFYYNIEKYTNYSGTPLMQSPIRQKNFSY